MKQPKYKYILTLKPFDELVKNADYLSIKGLHFGDFILSTDKIKVISKTLVTLDDKHQLYFDNIEFYAYLWLDKFFGLYPKNLVNIKVYIENRDFYRNNNIEKIFDLEEWSV